jgi:hypothetical protein
VETRNHAAAILGVDFPTALETLVSALLAIELSAEELIRSGGGEAKSTQRLRRALSSSDWPKHNFIVRKIVDGEEREATSHEIDHVHRSASGVIALEIEWNNKDPFFDRDLENFQRLHADGAISLGVIITRGSTLQAEMLRVIRECAERRGITAAGDLAIFDLVPTRRQADAVARRMAATGKPFLEVWSELFVADKFGVATTHWAKLMDRIARGVGNPCPLLLVGIPASAVKI